MSHKIAKLLLEKAGTFLDRKEAIHEALNLGMPLQAIQEYLDWLDAMTSSAVPHHSEPDQDLNGLESD